MKARRRKSVPRPGRRVGGRVRALALRRGSRPARWLALFIATGIGLHNFSEGLAIGQSAALDEISLALVLVIGFGLHNATEGFGIVAPLAGRRRAAELALPRPARPDRRRPDLPRHARRTGVDVDGASRSLFLALAAGSILYVVIELLNVCRRCSTKTLVAWGLLLGPDARVRHGLRPRRRRRLALDGRELRHRSPARHHARARRARSRTRCRTTWARARSSRCRSGGRSARGRRGRGRRAPPDGRRRAAGRAVVDELPPALVELALWLADYYGSTPARALALVAPVRREPARASGAAGRAGVARRARPSRSG